MREIRRRSGGSATATAPADGTVLTEDPASAANAAKGTPGQNTRHESPYRLDSIERADPLWYKMRLGAWLVHS